jgi:uncharacterized protein
MKKLVLVVLICTATLINGYSQTKQDLIKELFKVMKQDSMIEKTFSSIIPSMFNQMQSQSKDSTAKARSQEAMKSSMSVMKDIMKRMINEDMVAIYDKNFAENEIKDFIAFYKSASGQKLVNTQPEIQKEIMTVFIQKYLPEIQKATKAKMEETKANEKK